MGHQRKVTCIYGLLCGPRTSLASPTVCAWWDSLLYKIWKPVMWLLLSWPYTRLGLSLWMGVIIHYQMAVGMVFICSITLPSSASHGNIHSECLATILPSFNLEPTCEVSLRPIPCDVMWWKMIWLVYPFSGRASAQTVLSLVSMVICRPLAMWDQWRSQKIFNPRLRGGGLQYLTVNFT